MLVRSTWAGVPLPFAGLDNRRSLRAAQDITQNRPALSRWHPDYRDEFAEFLTLEAPFRR